MDIENIRKNSKNSFELEGNVANISEVHINKNGKKRLRFDLAQNNNENSKFIPIVIKGKLVDSYGKDIKKGQWITVKGIIDTYLKEKENENGSFNEKSIDIVGFEIIDRNNKKKYLYDGLVITNDKER